MNNRSSLTRSILLLACVLSLLATTVSVAGGSWSWFRDTQTSTVSNMQFAVFRMDVQVTHNDGTSVTAVPATDGKYLLTRGKQYTVTLTPTPDNTASSGYCLVESENGALAYTGNVVTATYTDVTVNEAGVPVEKSKEGYSFQLYLQNNSEAADQQDSFTFTPSWGAYDPNASAYGLTGTVPCIANGSLVNEWGSPITQEDIDADRLPEESEATEPTEESEATDPTEESEATEPTEESEATDPTEESEATEPTEESEATEPTEESEVTDPTEESEVTDPTEESEATDPTEESEATDPTEESEATDPTEESGATDPTEESGATDPTEESEVPQITSEVPPLPPESDIPSYYQTDYPHIPWGDGTLETDGSGVTCLAMAATYLTGQEYLPDAMAEICGSPDGDSTAYLETGAAALGLSWVTTEDFSQTLQALEEGQIAIVMLDGTSGQSSFTQSRHFLLVRGMTQDGRLLVSDPCKGNYQNPALQEGFAYGFDQSLIQSGCIRSWIFDPAMAV